MSEIVSTTLSLGSDRFDRRVTATRKLHYSGGIIWSIKIDAANQRDDTQEIEGLTDENIRALFNALKAVRVQP